MSTDVSPLLSGGAFLSVNGVDRWFPSTRLARDEQDARRPRGTIDYPDAAPAQLDQMAELAVGAPQK
jgi:hypothetical protein